MHELSLALSIVEIAEQQAAARHAHDIEELELEIGMLAGVEIETLLFALESAVKGTLLAQAKIVKRIIAGEGQCGECGAIFQPQTLYEPCPECGSYFVVLLKGKELKIKSLVIK